MNTRVSSAERLRRRVKRTVSEPEPCRIPSEAEAREDPFANTRRRAEGEEGKALQRADYNQTTRHGRS